MGCWYESKMGSEEKGTNIPFLWRDNLDDAGLHAVAIDLANKGRKVAELVHSLMDGYGQRRRAACEM